MKLLSHSGDQLVFLLEATEVDLLRWLREQKAGRRQRNRLSRTPEAMPDGASADLALAMSQRRRANRSFLRRVLQLEGPYLTSSRTSDEGYGLTLSRADVERLLQVLNDLKLAHWEHLGCPDEGAQAKKKPTPEEWPSFAVMQVVNELQMLLLWAIDLRD